MFTPDALLRVADFTSGIPRNINNLCFNCMSLGCALQKKVIDSEIVDEVTSDLDITQHTSQAAPTSLGYGPGSAQVFADDPVSVAAPLKDALEQVVSSTVRPANHNGNGHKNQILSPNEAKAYMQQIAAQLQGFSRVVGDVANGRKTPGGGMES
jgi:hypothetical protein